MAVEATAPGKAILFGEHSVVYSGPAVVMAINKRAKVFVNVRSDNYLYFDALDLGFSGYFAGDIYTLEKGEPWRGKRLQAFKVAAYKTMEHIGVKSGLNIKVRSQIPIAAGLGSSGAICVAIVAAVGKILGGNLSKREICDLAYEGEKIIHGTPSGVDNNISTYGGILRYDRESGIKRFKLNESPQFIIGNTKRKRSTRMLVERVRKLKERNPEVVKNIIDIIAKISEKGLEALQKNNLHRLGDLMNINHGLLASLGVSVAKLDIMTHASRKVGAYGAKLTGAGGGGCMIALCDSLTVDKIKNAIRGCRGEAHQVEISYEGVKTIKLN